MRNITTNEFHFQINRSFLCSNNSHVQNKARCKIFLVRTRFTYMRIKTHFHINGTSSALWNRSLRKLGDGPFLHKTNCVIQLINWGQVIFYLIFTWWVSPEIILPSSSMWGRKIHIHTIFLSFLSLTTLAKRQTTSLRIFMTN